MNHLKPGTKVTWTSQAGGYEKTKNGVIIAFIPKNDSGSLHYYLSRYLKTDPANLPFSRIKGQRVSQSDRYLIEVPRGGKSELSDYYLPYSSRVQVKA